MRPTQSELIERIDVFFKQERSLSENEYRNAVTRLLCDLRSHLADPWIPVEERLPHIGMTVKCPNGHEHTYQPYDHMSGRIYCTEGICWSDGCQGDSGSGTNYDFEQLTVMPLPPLPKKGEKS